MIRNIKKYMQFIDYSDLWAVTPAVSGDIDLCYMYKGAFVFVEYKTGVHTRVKQSQLSMYRTICDALNKAGHPATFCIACHEQCEGTVNGANVYVREAYYKGDIMPVIDYTVKEYLKWFFEDNHRPIEFRSDFDETK